MWKMDKDWKMRSNPIAANEERKRDSLDQRILEKRRNQRILKNQAMEQ